jgi:hypothetical protein
MGSTFFTHSWIGLPVVWCGMVYAYAIQDLAEFDSSFDWPRVAQGITNSAMWQQYTSGPSAGTYPDSWNMKENKPNPADINPENIMVNELRLRGVSPEPRWARIPQDACFPKDNPIFLNTSADIRETSGSLQAQRVRVVLTSPAESSCYSLLAPIPEPRTVKGTGERCSTEEALRTRPGGWVYDPDLKGVVLKSTFNSTPVAVDVAW